MPSYKHLFFDLDHTIWDFHTNQIVTLKKLFQDYRLERYFKDFDDFFERYMPINLDLWQQYKYGWIPKKDIKVGRFYKTFRGAGLDDLKTAENFANEFVRGNSEQTGVIPHTFDVLEYLKQKQYHLHIITNGFREAQHTKMDRSGLTPYFENIFISEDIGASKPDQRFFEHVIKTVSARKDESLVIGDSLENDIKGARDSGLDHVFFNPQQTAHTEKVFKEITSLKELIGWL
ncbi:MAG: YjjG family noncanonical pyrimidine nucleotidase [Marinilabilia sp.]